MSTFYYHHVGQTGLSDGFSGRDSSRQLSSLCLNVQFPSER